MSGISLHNKAIISIDILGRIQLSLQGEKISITCERLRRDIENTIHQAELYLFYPLSAHVWKILFWNFNKINEENKREYLFISISSFNNQFLNANFVEQATLQGKGKDQILFLTFSREIKSLIVSRASLVAQRLKHLAETWETRV